MAEHKKDLKKVSIENWRSTGKPTGGFHKRNMVGTLIYMAPEILKKEVHTEKSDVYSFGVSIKWELILCKLACLLFKYSNNADKMEVNVVFTFIWCH